MDWRFILSLLFAVVVAVFALQNAGPIEVKFFTLKIAVSQALIILISAMFGAVTMMLFSIVRWLKLRSKFINSTKKITALEEENTQLKQKLEAANNYPNKIVEQDSGTSTS
ncbi:MAG: LapA family protein [Syntrophomonadaceae bacterium]|jgi:uncharacterized integral membrane protein